MRYAQNNPTYGNSAMNLNLNTIATVFKSPLFWLGIGIRVALIHYTLNASSVNNWYAPFLENSLNHFSFDPWTNWISQGKTSTAFPYGYVMWLAFLPATIFTNLLGLTPNWGYILTLFIVDCALLAAFKLLINTRINFLLITYWLSPILLFGTYYLGLNDLIPVFFLTLSLYTLQQTKVGWSGALLLLAISAKLSMVLALPFYLIYFFHNKAIHQLLPQFAKFFLLVALIFLVPFVFSNGAIEMIRSNPEIPKLYQFSIALGSNISIYLTPLAYALAVYSAWSVKRMNFELFLATLGIAFLVVVLLAPSSAGWFIWSLPLLIYFQNIGGKKAFTICTLFAIIFVLSSLIATNSSLTNNFDARTISILHTFLVATGIILIALIWRKTIAENDYFKLSRKPFVIGISGDSGSGKDTLSIAIQSLFGNHSVTTLSGDDYHLWDRQKPLWEVMTHLNPIANDLESFSADLVTLSAEKPIHSRHYNHDTGKLTMGSILPSNDIIIASGLHTLHLPILRECLDLKIYLNIHEGLRQQFKINRDTLKRGYDAVRVLEAINKRASDSARFIQPQIEFADLVFSISPVNESEQLQQIRESNKIKLKLGVQSKISLNPYDLSRVLIGLCGLHVNENWNTSNRTVELMIEGEVSSEDLAMAAKSLCPKMTEFLDLNPKWENGTLGLMQLITLIHINMLLAKRTL